MADRASSGDLGVLLLGPVDVRLGAASLPIGGAKARAVLAQLALASGHIVSVSALIDGVWGEAAPATAQNTLQYHVGVLRKTLTKEGQPDPIQTRPPGYSLSVGTDIEVFRSQRLQADAAAKAHDYAAAVELYSAALNCWRGPALADLLSFPFAAARAVSLEEERLQAVESYFDASLAGGHGADLVPELEDLVAEQPTRERLWAQLMIALYRGGRQADALAAYARARDVLADELGLEPSPLLRETQALVLAQDSEIATPARPRPASTTPIAPSTRLRSNLPSILARVILPDGRSLELRADPMLIGRQDDADLVLLDDAVSRRHAQITPTVDGHVITDLGSTNGTYVNGNRVTVSTRLSHGDRIEFGESVLRYETDPG